MSQHSCLWTKIFLNINSVMIHEFRMKFYIELHKGNRSNRSISIIEENSLLNRYTFFSLILTFFKFYLFEFYFFYTAGSYQLSILNLLVYTCQSKSPNSSHHHPHHPAAFPSWCPYICSLHLCLYLCLANQFICTIFLDSTYMC